MVCVNVVSPKSTMLKACTILRSAHLPSLMRVGRRLQELFGEVDDCTGHDVGKSVGGVVHWFIEPETSNTTMK